MFGLVRRAAHRVLSAVDCGFTSFVNEVYQLDLLAPLREPALTDDELITVRQLIENEWPLRDVITQDVITSKWSDPDVDIAALIARDAQQIRGYAARTATLFDSAEKDARENAGGITAVDSAAPASNGVATACHSPGVAPVNADELHYAAGAIRAWLNGMPTEHFSASYFAELADRLSNAALELTPVST